MGLTHYEATWNSTDQIPQRAVDSGLIGRFDSPDPTSGGRTQRDGINAGWSRRGEGSQTQVSAYALRYNFDLFSDFSYYTRGCDTPVLAPQCNSATA